MKYLTIILWLIISSDLIGQSTVKFKYFDNCIDSVVDLKYEMTLLNKDARPLIVSDSIIIDEPGSYMVYVWREKGDYTASYNFSKIIENNKIYTDTIELPRLCWWFNNALHSQEWKYQFCDRICNGYEVDYYKNGQKWIEGKFKKGIPSGKIKIYDNKGFLVKIETYNKRGLKHITYKDYIRSLVSTKN